MLACSKFSCISFSRTEPPQNPVTRCTSPLPESITNRLKQQKYEKYVKPCKPRMFCFFMEQHVERLLAQYKERMKRAHQVCFISQIIHNFHFYSFVLLVLMFGWFFSLYCSHSKSALCLLCHSVTILWKDFSIFSCNEKWKLQIFLNRWSKRCWTFCSRKNRGSILNTVFLQYIFKLSINLSFLIVVALLGTCDFDVKRWIKICSKCCSISVSALLVGYHSLRRLDFH